MTPIASITLAVVATATLVATATTASAVPGYVKRACIGDYFSYCSQHAPGTPGVKQCFRKNGSSLSRTCVKALVKAGLTNSPAARKVAGK
ncbi:MAG: hypothetical protein AAFV45_10100 [Pseudomonadota bacterium]